MTKVEELYNDQELSYEISDDGYDIYLSGRKWMSQHEPYIPYPQLGYEGSCKKQIADLIESSKHAKEVVEEKDKKIQELTATVDDLISNVIPELISASANSTDES